MKNTNHLKKTKSKYFDQFLRKLNDFLKNKEFFPWKTPPTIKEDLFTKIIIIIENMNKQHDKRV